MTDEGSGDFIDEELKRIEERLQLPLRTFDKIPHSIVPSMDKAGLDSVYHYRLLDMISFSDAANACRGCIIPNPYFLKVLNISAEKLKRLLKGLEEGGFITREIIKARPFINTRRKIHPSDEVRLAWIEKYEKQGVAGLVKQLKLQKEVEDGFNKDSLEREGLMIDRNKTPVGEEPNWLDTDSYIYTGEKNRGSEITPGGVKSDPIEGQKRPIIKNNKRINIKNTSSSLSSKEERRREGGDAKDQASPPDPRLSEEGPSQVGEGETPIEPERARAAQHEAFLRQVPGYSTPDHKRRELPWEAASEEARTVLDLWNALGCGTVHPLKGPGARRALYLLDYSLLPRGMRVDRIVDAVLRFNDMAPEPDRHGLPLKKGQKISLEGFMAVPKFLKQRAHRWGRPEPVPLLRQLYGGNGDGLEEYTDEDQELYRELKRVYATYTLGVGEGDVRFSRKEELDMLRAVSQLRRCMAKGWLDPFYVGGQKPAASDYVDVLFRGLKRKYGADYGTGNMASEYTWNDLMPKFIQQDYGATVLDAAEQRGL